MKNEFTSQSLAEAFAEHRARLLSLVEKRLNPILLFDFSLASFASATSFAVTGLRPCPPPYRGGGAPNAAVPMQIVADSRNEVITMFFMLCVLSLSEHRRSIR